MYGVSNWHIKIISNDHWLLNHYWNVFYSVNLANTYVVSEGEVVPFCHVLNVFLVYVLIIFYFFNLILSLPFLRHYYFLMLLSFYYFLYFLFKSPSSFRYRQTCLTTGNHIIPIRAFILYIIYVLKRVED